MNNPFDYVPNEACRIAFDQLTSRLDTLRSSTDAADIEFCRELDAGKMLGVLIATDNCGERHTLYAFSGQSGDNGFNHPGFVGPVFDYLSPNGYFKKKEAEITCLNAEIDAFEHKTLAKIRAEYQQAKDAIDSEIALCKERHRLSKAERDRRRATGVIDQVENDEMIRTSQFEKAELRRIKARCADTLAPHAASINEAMSHLDALKDKRRKDSEALQQWLFSNTILVNARGERKSVSDIFAATSATIPPSGAGECCAPKLLQAAFSQGLHPEYIAEYWYGKPKGGQVRIHGMHYPACRGKCLPILEWMMQGLEICPPLDADDASKTTHTPDIIYENQWFCVVNKPSGMLSVPGKSRAVSLQQWLENYYGTDRHVKVAHRLDRDTSGLIIATFGEEVYKTMQSLFATRNISKTYIADLVGNYRALGSPEQGIINLPLSPDYLDRPRQRIDTESGKEAVTEYRFMSASRSRSRILLHPLTGRTHQLRVHCASESGLGMPIAGDPLYGNKHAHSHDRLHLHAYEVAFKFPIDGCDYKFNAPIDF